MEDPFALLTTDGHEFSSKKWTKTATACIYAATSSIDTVCREIVTCYRSISPSSEAAIQLRRISLTVASFERALYEYVQNIARAREEHRSQVSAAALAASQMQTRQHLRQSSTLSQASGGSGRGSGRCSDADDIRSRAGSALGPLQSPNVSARDLAVSHSASYSGLGGPLATHTQSTTGGSSASNGYMHTGGMVSLCQLLTGVLTDVKATLAQVEATSSVNKFRRYAPRTFALLLAAGPAAFFLCRPLFNIFMRFMPLSAKANSVWGLLVAWLLRWGVLPVPLLVYHKWLVRRHTQRLHTQHNRLGILLRLWHICTSLLDPNYQTARQNLQKAPISHWLLEHVPPCLQSSFWLHSSWRMAFLCHWFNVLYCAFDITNRWLAWAHPGLGYPFAFWVGLWYAVRPGAAAAHANALLGSPLDLRIIQAAWGVTDSGLARWVAGTVLPRIGLAAKLAVRREIVLSEDGGSLDLSGKNPAPDSSRTMAGLLSGDTTGRNAGSSVSEGLLALGVRDPSATLSHQLKCVLVTSQPVDICINQRLRREQRADTAHLQQSLTLPPVVSLRAQSAPVIIYFHGGGWISDFRAAGLNFVSRWSRALETVPIIYADYSLAPDAPYPRALEECVQLYKWVAEGRLGIEPSSIILAGSCVGGNLAAATVIRLLTEIKQRQPPRSRSRPSSASPSCSHSPCSSRSCSASLSPSDCDAEPPRGYPHWLKPPDGLVLAYPILNLRLAPTPSRALFMMDAILPQNLMLQCRSWYVPTHSDAEYDPCLSPLFTADEHLSQFPPTSLLVGSLDPFFDDSIEFAHRLQENRVPVKLKVAQNMPHSFLHFGETLPEGTAQVDVMAQWMKESIQAAAAKQSRGPVSPVDSPSPGSPSPTAGSARARMSRSSSSSSSSRSGGGLAGSHSSKGGPPRRSGARHVSSGSRQAAAPSSNASAAGATTAQLPPLGPLGFSPGSSKFQFVPPSFPSPHR